MGWATGAWAENAWAGTAWAAQSAPVEVPDVVGETQASGTTTLETALFVVAVQQDYSSTVAAGLIISQSPTAGSFANSGSTVTIVVSLGARPVSEGGSAKRQHRRRHLVEIDGQYFEVDGPAEAEALLKRAADLAEQAAEQTAVRNVKRVKRGKRVVEPALPTIATDSPELQSVVDTYREEIQAIYKRIAVDAELRELMRLQMLDDDDEEAIFVLLH